MQTPTVGRIVHFYAPNESEPQAAIVIKVWGPNCVNVSACNSSGTWNSYSSVIEGDPTNMGSARWAWPPRS